MVKVKSTAKAIADVNDSVVKVQDPINIKSENMTDTRTLKDKVIQTAVRQARIEQEMRIRKLLEPEIDKHIAETIGKIIFVDSFYMEDFNLTWNILGDEYDRKVKEIAEDKSVTDEQKKKMTKGELEAEKLKQWFKLVYTGFTDEAWDKMSSGALKILQMAVAHRKDNFFRQSGPTAA